MGAAETKTLIAEAAAQEFITQGYAATSLSAIAERLGLTKGALTYHFRTKSEYASHFLAVARDTTRQAISYAQHEYPRDGVRRLFLYFMLMGYWRERYAQHEAGMTLFADQTSPIWGAQSLIQDWRQLSLDAFFLCAEEENLCLTATPQEATDMLLVTSLGATFFKQHLEHGGDDGKPMRFLRMAMQSVGIPSIDDRADEVISLYRDHLPELA